MTIFCEPNRSLGIRSASAGRYRIEKLKGDIVTYAGPWFKNLITDNGLALMATSPNYLNRCFVGSGNAPPTVGDTSLQNQIGSFTNIASNSDSVSPEPPYCATRLRTWTWNAGAIVGNIAEVGVGEGPLNLFSRALILDPNGVPTSITVLADEQLRVSYEHSYYAPIGDHEFTLTLGGSLGGTYDVLARPCEVTSAAASAAAVGWGAWMAQNSNGSSIGNTVYNGDIGPVTGSPSGNANANNNSPNGIVSGPLTIESEVNWSLNQGNVAGGIRSIRKRLGNGMFQFQFTPPIPKDSSNSLTLVFEHSWGRRD